MQLGWSDENSSFYIDEHRINNTGWMMKWQWNGGVERKANPLLRECWTFLIYIFLHQQCSGACNSNSHARGLHYLTFVCKTSRENQCNEASRLEKMYQKSSALSIRFEMRRSPFANWIHCVAAKKPQPLCETLNKKGIGEKGIAATG
jgi:hypothetical protein